MDVCVSVCAWCGTVGPWALPDGSREENEKNITTVIFAAPQKDRVNDSARLSHSADVETTRWYQTSVIFKTHRVSNSLYENDWNVASCMCLWWSFTSWLVFLWWESLYLFSGSSFRNQECICGVLCRHVFFFFLEQKLMDVYTPIFKSSHTSVWN